MVVVNEEIMNNLEEKIEEKLNRPYEEYYLLNYDAENNILASLRKEKKKTNDSNTMYILMDSKYINIKKSTITKEGKIIVGINKELPNDYIGNKIARKIRNK